MSNGQHQLLFQPDLLKNEKIMWSGQPEPGINFTKGDIFLIPFSLFFAGFALTWFGAVIFSVPQNPGKSAGFIIFFISLACYLQLLACISHSVASCTKNGRNAKRIMH